MVLSASRTVLVKTHLSQKKQALLATTESTGLRPLSSSKQNLCFFVFFGVGNQGPRGQGQTWGGQLWGVCLGVLLGGPDFGGFARGEKLSRGCLCLKETESSQQCALWRHTPSGQRLSGIMCATALRLGRTCESILTTAKQLLATAPKLIQSKRDAITRRGMVERLIRPSQGEAC